MSKHPIRVAAEKAHAVALAAERAAETTTEEKWEIANAACNATRKALVAAEMQYPTYEERRKEANMRYLASRGLLD